MTVGSCSSEPTPRSSASSTTSRTCDAPRTSWAWAIPVVVDNGFEIWRSFGNNYWPAAYLIDPRGGRSAFTISVRAPTRRPSAAIQQLLGVEEETARVDADGLAEAADLDTLASPETYLGSARGERRSRSGDAPLELNSWALTGSLVGRRGGRRARFGSRIVAYRFQARDVNLVLAPATEGGPVRFSVRLDGQPPGDDHGLDVDDGGDGAVSEPRMYQLVRRRARVAEGDFEITFHDPGVRAYVFTFG